MFSLLERWGGWLILIILASATTWLLRSLQEDSSASSVKPSHLPDYTLTEFTTQRMDEQGQLKNQLTATAMAHYQDTDTELTMPSMVFYKKGQPTWTVQAEKGKISPDGNQIWLLGQTVLQQQPNIKQNSLKIISKDVRVQLDTEYAETVAATTILSRHGETRSIGMRVFIPTQQVELFSQVRGRYVPQ
jgi:lipopolysaccharide export system protein LptC